MITQETSRPHLFNELDRCRTWIDAALEYSGGTHDWYDVVQGILEGRFQLWPAENGCIVTEILTYPRKRIINVFLGGGEINDLIDLHGPVIEWAKQQGCTAATINGRAGWERKYRDLGWKPMHRTIVKEFN